MGSPCTEQSGIIIDDNTNIRIIVDNIFSWAKLLKPALLYMGCQLYVCQAYQLSLRASARVTSFPNILSVFQIDVCSDGNCPVMSKHQLLEHWPQWEFVRDVAKIVRFAQFYGKFNPQFEL
jgi:hypothetical protein